MIVIDTHVLVWWSTKSKKLSKKAAQEFEIHKKRQEVCVSSISLWEIALLVKKGKINFTIGFDIWLKEIESVSFLRFIPVDNSIAINSINLPDFTNKDPADKIIVATAINLGAKLITSDRRILNYKGVNAIW